MTSIPAELEYPSDFSRFRPSISERTVIRRGQIDTITHNLDSSSIIYVNGLKNIGKTTILNQIYNELIGDSICLFIDENIAKTLSDTDIYRDLYIQIRSFLGEFDQKDFTKEINFPELKKIFTTLIYSMNLKKRNLYFILDGMSYLEEISPNFLAELYFNVPTNQFIKYIISCEKSDYENLIPSKKAINFSLSILLEIEVKELIPSANPDELDAIKNTFGFSPEKISSISRLVELGHSIEDILMNTSDECNALYEAEWEHTINDKISKLIVGFLTFWVGNLTLKHLSNCTGINVTNIMDCINKISFINIDKENIQFTSVSFRAFASKKLELDKFYYIDKIITSISSDQENEEVNNLPIYFGMKGDNKNIIQHVNDDYISTLFKKNHSLNEVHKSVNIVSTASIQENDELMVTRSLHLKSGLSSISISEALVSQLRCYLAEDENHLAVELIDTANSNEEKLQLYCIYCIHLKENGTIIPDETSNKVDFLFDKVEAESLGIERVTDIAADLLPVFPEKAMKLINETDKLNSSGQNKSDNAFMQSSLMSLHRHGSSFTDDLDSFSEFSDSKASMLAGINVFKLDSPASKVIEYIDSFDESGDKIFLLRSWLKNYKNQDEAILILNKALTVITETTDFSSNATIYSDITACLKECSSSTGNESYQRVIAQLERLKGTGPTLDYCKLVLNISSYELLNCIDNVVDRIDSLLDYLLTLNDNSIALACLALIDNFVRDKSIVGLSKDIPLEKKILADNLIENDAYHIDVFKDAIWYEAKFELGSAMDWASRLNNEPRRSKARSIALESYLKNAPYSNSKSVNDLISFLRSISEEDHRTESYELLVKNFKNFSPSKANSKKLVRVLNKIQNNILKIKCHVNHALNCHKLDIVTIDTTTFKALLSTSVDTIEGTDNKVELCFFVHEKLIKYFPDVANEFKEKAIKLTSKNGYSNSNFSTYIIHSIDLATRALYILIGRDLDSASDFDSITDSLEPITNVIDKVRSLARVVSAYQKNNRENDANMIIEKFILPILDKYKTFDSREFNFCSLYSLPVLYIYSEESFLRYFDRINKLNNDLKEKIIRNTIEYIYRDCLIGDPYEAVRNNKVTVKYKDLLKIQTLISYIKDDSNIIFQIRSLLKAINSLKKSRDITKTQMLDIVSKIKNDYYDSFPRPNYIAHEGYKIILMAEIKSFNPSFEDAEWDSIITMAREIPNTSDRAFTISEIGSLIPETESNTKKLLFKEAELLIDTLSSNLEKVNRYRQLGDTSRSVDRQIAKSNITKAFKLCNTSNNPDDTRSRLETIDMANKLGEPFAASLSSMFDDDPARQKIIRENILEKKKDDETKRKFEKNEKFDDSISDEKLADLAWEQLGFQNAKSGHCPKSFNITEFLSSIKGQDLSSFYKILSFYIHQLNSHSPSNKTILDKIRPIFDGFIKNAQTITSIYYQKTINDNAFKGSESTEYIMLMDGEDSKATSFLTKWFKDNNSNSLTIIDPYFSLEDLSLIAQVINKDPEVSLTIVSSYESRKKLLTSGHDEIEELITEYWNESISKTSLPAIDFLFIAYGSNNQFPFHDRWWLTEQSTVTTGTSISGFGRRISQIMVLDLEKTMAINEKIKTYLTRKQRKYQQEKLTYKTETF